MLYALTLALGLSLASASATQAPPPPSTAAETEPKLEQRRDGRVTVDVLVNGQGPFPFIIDTGANRSAIGRTLAERLALPVSGENLIHGVSGSEMRPSVMVQDMRSGDLQLGDGAFPLIEQTTLGNAAGLLAANELLSQGVDLDFRRQRFRVVKSRKRELSNGLTVIKAQLRFGTLLAAPCKIGQTKVTCIIDTGSVYSFATPSLAALLLDTGAGTLVAREVVAFGVTVNPLIGDMIKIDRMQLGDTEVMDNFALATNAHVFKIWALEDEPALLLGVNVLRAYERVRIDYPTATVSLGVESCNRPTRICQTR